MSGIDVRAAVGLTGRVTLLLCVPLLLPLAAALYYGEPMVPFLAAIAVAVAIGGGLLAVGHDRDIGTREGLFMVTVTWLVVAMIGAVPYLTAAHGLPGLVAPQTPTSTLGSPVNALFESMSGFTTTGATVLGVIDPAVHGRAMLLWRQLTQWLGGMGIVVLAVAILPRLSVGGAQLMETEAPGPGIEKLKPHIAATARTLWTIYIALTALEVALLALLGQLGLDPAMTPYNALAHGLTTMPTGGFSPAARSIETFAMVTQLVIIPFMVIAGTNFALLWHLLQRDGTAVLGDGEFRGYVTATVGVAGLLTVILALGSAPGAVGAAMVDATFQAVAIVTTTGYASVDYTAWPMAGQLLLLVAMFIGGSTGSTGGGIKLLRWVLIIKAIRRDLFAVVHPRAVRPVRLNGRAVDEDALQSVQMLTLVYLLVLTSGAVLIALDTAVAGLETTGLELIGIAATAIGNVGPAFGQFGPMGSFLELPTVSKLVMIGLMWVGRLEVIPVLVLLTRAFWRG